MSVDWLIWYIKIALMIYLFPPVCLYFLLSHIHLFFFSTISETRTPPPSQDDRMPSRNLCSHEVCEVGQKFYQKLQMIEETCPIHWYIQPFIHSFIHSYSHLIVLCIANMHDMHSMGTWRRSCILLLTKSQSQRSSISYEEARKRRTYYVWGASKFVEIATYMR